jgi:hypothetical protein
MGNTNNTCLFEYKYADKNEPNPCSCPTNSTLIKKDKYGSGISYQQTSNSSLVGYDYTCECNPGYTADKGNKSRKQSDDYCKLNT